MSANNKEANLKEIKLTILSKRKRELMGVSILLIMLFHSRSLLPGPHWIKAIIDSLWIGVEFFLVLSGMGIFFSLKKNPQALPFYKRRLSRILPAYIIVAVPYYLFQLSKGFSVRHVLLQISTLAVFWGDKTFWFVNILILCYFIAPLYFKLYEKRDSLAWALPFILLPICAGLSSLYPPVEIVVMRIPIFFLGMNIGYLIHQKKDIPSVWFLTTLLLFICFITRYNSIIWTIVYFFISVPVLCGIGFLVDSLCPSRFNQMLSFTGSISWELYLLHERICIPFSAHIFREPISIVLGSFVLAFILATLLSRIESLIIIRH